jgi:hypothetical protein
MRRLARLIAFALLAWLPLQAAALPALMTACELDPEHSPMHRHDEGAAGHHGDHAGHGDEGTSGSDGHSGHSADGHGCCHHFSTAAPALAVAFPDAARDTLAAGPIPRSDFFPEQPKRPPLAAL